MKDLIEKGIFQEKLCQKKEMTSFKFVSTNKDIQKLFIYVWAATYTKLRVPGFRVKVSTIIHNYLKSGTLHVHA